MPAYAAAALPRPVRPRSTSLRALSRLFLALLGTAVIVAIWSQIGSVQLGGRASYVVTDGTSMLPHFRGDGLVITRSESSYRVGEVVAYHNQQLHSIVMHRIVAMNGDRFIFKGDNNDFRDSYEPLQSQLVGKEWIYLPGAGKYFDDFRQPAVFGVTLVIVTLFALLAFPAREPRRSKRHHSR